MVLPLEMVSREGIDLVVLNVELLQTAHVSEAFADDFLEVVVAEVQLPEVGQVLHRLRRQLAHRQPRAQAQLLQAASNVDEGFVIDRTDVIIGEVEDLDARDVLEGVSRDRRDSVLHEVELLHGGAEASEVFLGEGLVRQGAEAEGSDVAHLLQLLHRDAAHVITQEIEVLKCVTEAIKCLRWIQRHLVVTEGEGAESVELIKCLFRDGRQVVVTEFEQLQGGFESSESLL